MAATQLARLGPHAPAEGTKNSLILSWTLSRGPLLPSFFNVVSKAARKPSTLAGELTLFPWVKIIDAA